MLLNTSLTGLPKVLGTIRRLTAIVTLRPCYKCHPLMTRIHNIEYAKPIPYRTRPQAQTPSHCSSIGANCKIAPFNLPAPAGVHACRGNIRKGKERIGKKRLARGGEWKGYGGAAGLEFLPCSVGYRNL